MDKAFEDLGDWLTVSDMPNGKKRVLQAALKLFSKQGYDGTSTAQIAEESQMSQATIFKYFKSKDDLLMFIVEPIVEHVLPIYIQDFAKDVQANTADLEKLIKFIVHNRYQFLIQNKEAAMILISQVLVNDKIKELLLKQVSRMKPIFIKNIWSPLQATGQIRADIDIMQFIRLTVGQLGFYFLQTQRIIGPRDAEETEKDLQVIARSIILAIRK